MEAYREYPINGDGDGILEIEEVDKTPHGRAYERSDYDEQKPVRATGPRRCRTRHTYDADHLRKQTR